MGIFKRDPEKIRRNAAEMIGDGEEIRALTVCSQGGAVTAGSKRRYAIVATDDEVYVISVSPLGLGAKLHMIEHEFPIATTKAEKVSLGLHLNDIDLTQENFWKKETVELADFINSRSSVSPTSEVEAS